MTYFIDETNNTYWILEYPDSGEHDGGIPILRLLEESENPLAD